MERCFTTKSAWQYANVFENLNKVILNNLTTKSTNQMILSSPGGE